MRHVCIDIETTGLDPEWCQVLEVGMIVDDTNYSSELNDPFHAYVLHERIIGDPFALALNAKILAKIAKRESGFLYLTEREVIPKMIGWLLERGIEHFNPSGKNFNGFDRQFLKRMKMGGHLDEAARHRALDPAQFYALAGDVKLPSLTRCLNRAGLVVTDLHTAVGDAWDVCRLLRGKLP